MRIESQARENRSPEPSASAESRSPHTLQTYSEDLRSLSESERETIADDPEFKDWLHKKALQLPHPPQLIEQWISKQSKLEANQRDYLKSKGSVTTSKVPPPPPDRFQIESSCIAAHDQGDRPFILAKLSQLWQQGWHDLIEDLCQLYPTWGVMTTDSGVMEVGQWLI